MKGKIKEDFMPTSNYELIVVGMVPLTVIEMTGIEDELNKTELPDHTVASSGTRKATECEITTPMHHTVEQLALEAWFKEGQDPVTATYKKAATLIHKSNSGRVLRTFSLIGVFVFKRGLPELKMVEEGEMAVVKWSLSIDDLEPI